VVEGDTIIGIAEKFGLKPATILLGNYYILADDPHKLILDRNSIFYLPMVCYMTGMPAMG
jgi:hypothetical protein